MTLEEIQARFEDDRPAADGGVVDQRRAFLHSVFREAAFGLNDSTEDGREKSLALTKLEEGLAWALKGAAKT